MTRKGESSKERILDAAETLIMQHGFAGTSVDDILKGAGLTKGAFFHHFDGKGALARELVERHAQKDIAFFTDQARRAEERSNDPLEQVFLFMEEFEDYVSKLGDQPPGCIYAVYTYESMQFDPAINAFIAQSLRRWAALYEKKFEAVLARHKPAVPVTARDLAETIIAIIEGGFVLSRSYNDPLAVARLSRQFRQYIELLFAASSGKKRKP